MSEANSVDSTAPDWRDVEGASSPTTAAWLLLDRTDQDRMSVKAVAGLLAALAAAPQTMGDTELSFLASSLERAADAVADAIAEAMDILGAVSAAEREREQAAEAAEASSVEALLRRADMQDRLAGIAAGMAAEARQLARDAGAGL